MNLLTLLLAFVGAGAWIPTIITYFKKSRIEFKLIHCNFMNDFTISLYTPDNEKVEAKTNVQCVTMGFILTTYHKRNVVTEIQSTIRMKDGKEITGVPYTKTLYFENDDKTNGSLTIPGNMNILVNNDIHPDTSGIFYCNFLFEHPYKLIYKEIESIVVTIKYQSPRESIKHVVLNNDEIMDAARINYIADLYTIYHKNVKENKM